MKKSVMDTVERRKTELLKQKIALQEKRALPRQRLAAKKVGGGSFSFPSAQISCTFIILYSEYVFIRSENTLVLCRRGRSIVQSLWANGLSHWKISFFKFRRKNWNEELSVCFYFIEIWRLKLSSCLSSEFWTVVWKWGHASELGKRVKAIPKRYSTTIVSIKKNLYLNCTWRLLQSVFAFTSIPNENAFVRIDEN